MEEQIISINSHESQKLIWGMKVQSFIKNGCLCKYAKNTHYCDKIEAEPNDMVTKVII